MGKRARSPHGAQRNAGPAPDFAPQTRGFIRATNYDALFRNIGRPRLWAYIGRKRSAL